MGPEIILFADINFGGLHTHLYQTTEDFTQIAMLGQPLAQGNNDASWNDVVSSIIVTRGQWRLWRDIFEGNPRAEIGPGIYPDGRDLGQGQGIDNDSLSSIVLLFDTGP